MRVTAKSEPLNIKAPHVSTCLICRGKTDAPGKIFVIEITDNKGHQTYGPLCESHGSLSKPEITNLLITSSS